MRRTLFSPCRFFLISLVLCSFVAASFGRNGAYTVSAATKPFKYAPSASVQKAFDLLAKYKIPAEALKTLVTIFNDAKKLTEALKGFKHVTLTDAQIADFVAAAKALATDKKDPLTPGSYKSWVAAEAAASLKKQKVPPAAIAAIAKAAGPAPVRTGKAGAASAPAQKSLSKADVANLVKQADSSLTSAEIDQIVGVLWFYVVVGFDEEYYQLYIYDYAHDLAVYYGVPASELDAFIASFDDPKALQDEMVKLGLPDDAQKDIVQNDTTILDGIDKAEFSSIAVGGLLEQAQDRMYAAGLTEDQISQVFAKAGGGDLNGALALAGQFGVPATDLQAYGQQFQDLTAQGMDPTQFVAESQALAQDYSQTAQDAGTTVNDANPADTPSEPANPDTGAGTGGGDAGNAGSGDAGAGMGSGDAGNAGAGSGDAGNAGAGSGDAGNAGAGSGDAGNGSNAGSGS